LLIQTATPDTVAVVATADLLLLTMMHKKMFLVQPGIET
jgi:hypothetical protein